MTLQDRIKSARKLAGLKQRELAARSKVAISTIGNIEAGRRHTPRQILAIAQALNVRPEWLLNGTGSMQETEHIEPVVENQHHMVLVTLDELGLLTNYRSASEDGQRFIRDSSAAAIKAFPASIIPHHKL